MEEVFGKNGISIWNKANGIDLSPVIPYRERKSISTERTFDRDTIDVRKLEGLMTAMAENLVFQLRRGGKLTACLTVKIRYSDFQTYTLQKMIPFSKSVYMIAYADNKNAEILQHHKENTEENRLFFAKKVEEALGIEVNTLKIIAIKDYYWPIGTHYYEPLDKDKYHNRSQFIREAQHPERGMLVVGEAVSR
jgi:nucleotidyltransferase/DNA polymerase involved in DNA repair